jgi:hypothetical protein
MHSRNRAGFDHSNSDLPDCRQELDSSNHISLPKAKHPGSFTLECFVAIARFFILCFLTVPGLLHTVLEEDLMIFRGLLGGQPGDMTF